MSLNFHTVLLKVLFVYNIQFGQQDAFNLGGKTNKQLV